MEAKKRSGHNWDYFFLAHLLRLRQSNLPLSPLSSLVIHNLDPVSSLVAQNVALPVSDRLLFRAMVRLESHDPMPIYELLVPKRLTVYSLGQPRQFHQGAGLLGISQVFQGETTWCMYTRWHPPISLSLHFPNIYHARVGARVNPIVRKYACGSPQDPVAIE